MPLIELTEKTLPDCLDNNRFMLIDFWAPWCAPCQDFMRVCEAVAADFTDCCFARVNIEAEPTLAEDFSVRSVPFIMVLRDRVALYAESGSMTEPALRTLLTKAREADIT